MNVLFMGLGRIGLPQSLVFAKKGFQVYGYDLDDKVIAMLQEKKTPFFEPGMDDYLAETLSSSFHPFSDFAKLNGLLETIDAIYFTVGTGVPNAQSCLQDDGLDLTNIFNALDGLVKLGLKKGVALVFRTTLSLGSVDRIRDYLKSNHSLTEGEDVHLAFVPERLVEGQAVHEEETLPKLIGAYSDAGFEKIKSIFEKIGGDIVRLPDPKTAEFCKLTDNSYRNTMFAFANEIAMCAEEVGVDVMEVIKAGNHQYGRNHIPKPGFVSGYCLGKDPYTFECGFNKAFPDRDFQSLWYYGRRTNDYLMQYVDRKLKQNLKDPRNSKVLVLGCSFKEDVDDFRMSHVLNLVEMLQAHGVRDFNFYDPHFGINKYTQLPESMQPFVSYGSQKLDEKLFEGVDLILIANRHKALVDANSADTLKKYLSHAKPIVAIYDAWNVWREAAGIEGVNYQALGLGEKE